MPDYLHDAAQRFNKLQEDWLDLEQPLNLAALAKEARDYIAALECRTGQSFYSDRH